MAKEIRSSGIKCFMPLWHYHVPVFVIVGTKLLGNDRHSANILPPLFPLFSSRVHLHANTADLVDLKIKRWP